MQSATSDVNTAVMMWRQVLVNGITYRNKINIVTALNNLNSILPAELSLIFDSGAYQDATKIKYFVVCPKCEKENYIESSKISVRIPDPGLSTLWSSHLTGYDFSKPKRFMNCFECKIELNLSSLPYRLKDPGIDANRICPEQPHTNSTIDTIFNESHFWIWVKLVSGKLENQFREFRDTKSATSGAGDLALFEDK